jgi:hypothetical protein
VISEVHALDAAAVLHTTEAVGLEQRERDVDVLRLVLQWADIHSGDPGAGRVLGADQLLAFGGDGTPPVQELCWAELAIARQAGVVATQRLAADALDLRHRLSLLWEAVQHLKVPVWVARKVAGMSRELSKDAAGLVDAAVAAAVDQSPGRILAIAEAKVIEADIEAHRARLAADAAKIGVRLSHPRPGDAVNALDGEPASLRLTLKLPPGTATRTHHRVKTHKPGYDVQQLGIGTYRWVTPHGLGRLVTPNGTRRIELLRNKDGQVIGELHHSDNGPAPPGVKPLR